MNGSQKPGKANAALLLNAKYHPDPESRELAGMEAVSDCLECGDLASLAGLLADKENPPAPKVMDAARKALVPTASKRSELDGNDDAALGVLRNEAVPNPSRRELGLSLRTKYLNDEAGMMRVATATGAPFDVRESAGLVLLDMAAEGLRFGLLFELTTNQDVPYPVRKSAGLKLIELAIEHGNYPILLRMDAGSVPTDVNLELEGTADIAAAKAVSAAVAAKDAYMLASVSEAKGLSESVRRRASESAAALANSAPLPFDGLPDGDRAKELMGRLARSRFPPRSEPPPSIRPGKSGR